MKTEQQKKGVDIIDLGVGDPDLPTPPHIVAALCAAAQDPHNHHYPSYAGLPAYREAVAGWYHQRFGVKLDASKETLALMGSKDGITHIGEAFVNPGDYVLAPSPGYPGIRPAPCLPKVKSTRCRFYGRTISSRFLTIYQRRSCALQNSCSSITPIIPPPPWHRSRSIARWWILPRTTILSWSRTTPTRKLRLKATSPRHFWRHKGQRKSGSRCTRSPRPTT